MPFGSALSGFDAAWEEQQAIQREQTKKNPGADLFPDPPSKAPKFSDCAIIKCSSIEK